MTIEDRLARLEQHDGALTAAVHDLQEAMTVTAGIQRRQAEVQQRHGEEIEAALKGFLRLSGAVEQLTSAVSGVVDKLDGVIGYMETMRTDVSGLATSVSEVVDKLDGLIGYIDSLQRRPLQ